MDPTNTNTALASAFCEELARCGMTRAVICPGSRSTPLALALLREPSIETTTIVDERSAGFVALGAAAASGLPVAVACTSGTAATNLHPAVSEADESSLPLIVLTSDRPPELRGIGAGQTIDQIKLYGSAVRWFCEAGTHAADDPGLLHLRTSACRAFAAARGDARPGPVHVNLSWRDPLGPEPVAGALSAVDPLALQGRVDTPLTRVAEAQPPVGEDLLAGLATMLADAPRGLIVAGRQLDTGLAEPLAALSRASGYPILAEPTSQLRAGPHDRSRVVSSYDQIAKTHPPELAPELVLRFGELPTSKALRGWLGSLSDCEQVLVDPLGAWNEPTRRASSILRADAIDLALQLADRLEPGEEPQAFGERWLEADRAVATALGERLAALENLTEPSLWPALADAAGDGDLVFTASSMPIRDQEAFLPSTQRELLFLANRGANGIDGTISSAVGAAMGSARPAWVVLGDLALHHDSNGLAAIRHSPVPVRVVVVDNDGGGIFEFLPQAEQVSRDEFEAIFGTPVGLDAANYARLHDLPFIEATTPAELASLPAESCIVRVRSDRASNVALHRELDSATAAALAEALSGGGASSSAS
jgi:2-succinyl-5-enolpyruvyl-6-hydroxy-3-cyclohexene-1-carboxylate synthase